MRPYKFMPCLREKLWGGDRIAAFKGLAATSASVGESWEISGVPGHESVTAERGLPDDPDVGITLGELIGRYREKLVGADVYRRFGRQFPLLIKFIDSRQDLSVQVHPDDALAKARHDSFGKTEMWYVVKADPGAKIYAGLRKPMTPEQYEELVRSGEGGRFLDEFVACHESHDGDLFFLPAGRLHAIGAGNFVAEIQQTSDITYRVYDYGRKDAAGRQRELHVAEAKDAIDYRVWPAYRSSYDSTVPTSELVRCPYFHVNRVVVRDASRIDLKCDSFVVVVCLRGEAVLNGVSVRQGETLLVPAAENVLYVFGNATFLTATA
ncbi:MAG: type I phosphomannose isomerase catalytic subunit [Kiritimatiellia bacterium]